MSDDYVIVWTDGACSNNQERKLASAGVGVYFGPNSPFNISEHLRGNIQTNQRAELTAVIRALGKNFNFDRWRLN
jgi:ribonuclease HI